MPPICIRDPFVVIHAEFIHISDSTIGVDPLITLLRPVSLMY